MVICYIALGSNLGNRAKNIDLALKYLREDPAIIILKTSSFIETKPQGVLLQAKFLNGVIKIKTDYSAQELLKKLQAVETKMGRSLPRPKNEPRTIDLDILIYADMKIEEETLQIPHPRMWQRDFVITPLKEIAPELFLK
ncbi:MAG: 2-amino-4-hydroxy-6-hydroxymethyldihydropteridine diphosphokinase [Candidatus Omnitrophota bacterium]|nr:MAG: 2-amino-4-hydroxy-6-hydroxymethyldihydropteridine diphosphokinase [Candidatus Omnitrophota bacterium]